MTHHIYKPPQPICLKLAEAIVTATLKHTLQILTLQNLSGHKILQSECAYDDI